LSDNTTFSPSGSWSRNVGDGRVIGCPVFVPAGKQNVTG
jgi:hypothetical protein